MGLFRDIYDKGKNASQHIEDELNLGNHDLDELEPMAERAPGESITPRILNHVVDHKQRRAIVDFLDENEQPQYLVRGKTIDIQSDDDSDSLLGTDRNRKWSVGDPRCFTIVTDRRVLILIQQVRGYDERSVALDAIDAVDLDTGLRLKRLALQAGARTYYIGASATDQAELDGAMAYIRDTHRESRGGETGGEGDPLERLDRTRQLHDEGAITDEEFESTKERLLSRL